MLAQERDEGHEDPRGAEAALQGMRVAKRFLDGVKGLFGAEGFHGAYVGAVGLDGEHETRPRSLPVHQYGAGAAHAMLAPHVGAGETELVTEEVAEKETRLDGALDLFAVDRERDRVGAGYHRRIVRRGSAAQQTR